VSLKQARALVKQLVEGYGEIIRHPMTGKFVKLFPTAEILSKSDLELVKTTENRKNTIREFSQQILKREIELNPYQSLDILKEKLLKIKGIGPWSVEYIKLRALGDTDAFPSTDLILKRAIEKNKNLDFGVFRPWRSYIAVYFWKHYAKSLSKTKGRWP
jgi:AraC family transcriptional regulator of adaptative response / DNA-3-methyladenine glycosylase II